MDFAIVGFARSGKTTLFKALTQGASEAGPRGRSRDGIQIGVTRVSDPRLDALASLFKPEKITSAELNYWDVPAALGGATGSAGISGQFFNQLQRADALLHLVRAFEDPSVAHLKGRVDPRADAQALEAELVLSDLTILERRSERLQTSLKGARGHERDLLLREEALLQRIKEHLEKEVPVREQQISSEEANILVNYQLLTAKPLLVVYNIDEAKLSDKKALDAELARTYCQPGIRATSICAKLEAELTQLPPEEERLFRESLGAADAGAKGLVRQSLELLGLISFLTFVSKEVRAWTVPYDAPAVKAAGRIHSDMERGFIRAEVISLEDLMTWGSVAEAKKRGLLRLEGKTYPVKDGDVITFLFNV